MCEKKGFQVCRVSQIQIRWFRCISYVFISGALQLRLRDTEVPYFLLLVLDNFCDQKHEFVIISHPTIVR